MIDINDVLRQLNALNLKESKNNIDKLMNLIKTDQKINKFFNSQTIFAFFVLSIVEFFIKIFKIMQLNNICAITANEMQRIINITLYKSLIVLFVIALVISLETTMLKQI